MREKILNRIISLLLYAAIFGYFFGVLCEVAQAKQIKIAIIDSGITPKVTNKLNLCENGHKDFTETGIEDNIGHGTNIAGLIGDQLTTEYCLIIIKIFDPNNNKDLDDLSASAIQWAILQKSDIINYSAGGNAYYNREYYYVKKALDKGIVFVAAAGNDNMNLNHRAYYPALYDPRVVVVGSVAQNGKKARYSNYGRKVDVYVNGNNHKKFSIKLSGTSQSSAIVTNRIAKQIHLKQLLNSQIELVGKTTTDNLIFEYENFTK